MAESCPCVSFLLDVLLCIKTVVLEWRRIKIRSVLVVQKNFWFEFFVKSGFFLVNFSHIQASQRGGSCVFVVLSSLVQSIIIKAFRSTNSERRKRFTLSLVTYVNKLMQKMRKNIWLALYNTTPVSVTDYPNARLTIKKKLPYHPHKDSQGPSSC